MKKAYPALARKRAIRLLAEFSVSAPPIDPEAIAREANVPVQTRSDFPRNVFGALARQGDQFSVFVSSKCETPGHRRFTVSHELGHYYLDGHVEALLGSTEIALSSGGNYRGQKDPYEVEADAFASELLMPSPIARAFTQDLPPSIASVRRIADKFVVSLSAAAIRLTTFSNTPCFVALSFEGAIEWLSMSPTFEGHPWARTFMRGEWIPKGSGTSRLVKSPDRVLAGDEEDGSSLLCEWLEGAPALDVTDECLGLGRYGRVLTVVHCPDLKSVDDGDQEDDDRPNDWRDALRPYRLD